MRFKHLLFASALCTTFACDPLDGYDDHEFYCGVVLDKYEIIGMSVNGADNMQYIEAVNDCSGNTEALEVINALYKRTEIGDTTCFGRHW